MDSLSSDVSSCPSVGFFSVYKINLVLMTLLGSGNTLNGRCIKWYHSLVIFRQPISPKQRVSFSTGKMQMNLRLKQLLLCYHYDIAAWARHNIISVIVKPHLKFKMKFYVS